MFVVFAAKVHKKKHICKYVLIFFQKTDNTFVGRIGHISVCGPGRYIDHGGGASDALSE